MTIFGKRGTSFRRRRGDVAVTSRWRRGDAVAASQRRPKVFEEASCWTSQQTKDRYRGNLWNIIYSLRDVFSVHAVARTTPQQFLLFSRDSLTSQEGRFKSFFCLMEDVQDVMRATLYRHEKDAGRLCEDVHSFIFLLNSFILQLIIHTLSHTHIL